MGQLRKRGTIWWMRYYRNGQRVEESARTSKYEEARDQMKSREGDVAKGVPLTSKIGRLRFEEAAADLETDYTINAKKSMGNVKRHIKSLGTWFAGRRMATVTTADIRAYVAQRQKDEYANATINRELAALKRMFRLAMQAGKLLQRPHIPMLDEHNVRKGFFEREQFIAVRARLTPPLQAIATLAYYTGWRTKSEVLPLTWAHVDRVNGVIRLDVGTTKNTHGRTFKYGRLPELRAAIDARWQAHQELARTGVLCPSVFERKGKPVKSYRKAWLTACAAAGCPGRIPHDFRRTAVRNLTRAGVTDTIAMKMTGHKTRAVFDRYDITSEADLDDAAVKLAAFAGTIPGTIGQIDDAAARVKASA